MVYHFKLYIQPESNPLDSVFYKSSKVFIHEGIMPLNNLRSHIATSSKAAGIKSPPEVGPGSDRSAPKLKRSGRREQVASRDASLEPLTLLVLGLSHDKPRIEPSLENYETLSNRHPL